MGIVMGTLIIIAIVAIDMVAVIVKGSIGGIIAASPSGKDISNPKIFIELLVIAVPGPYHGLMAVIKLLTQARGKKSMIVQWTAIEVRRITECLTSVVNFETPMKAERFRSDFGIVHAYTAYAHSIIIKMDLLAALEPPATPPKRLTRDQRRYPSSSQSWMDL
ncbi:hypothetical protein ACJ73_06134 [Blastomyces percursus]|uniref:Uncharacterized protein n=1 Tax=Blastomyces percursus TaxID=1658174 RepID=A0A1J9R4G3_9EURO|nr:hypothetical protein ACJ73_06134 [Blastomyces percursus]